MKTNNHRALMMAFIFALAIFIYFVGSSLSGGLMNGGMNGSGWLGERGWMSTPAIIVLALCLLLGWTIVKKRKH